MPASGLTQVHNASLVSDAVPLRLARARASRHPMRVHSIYRSVVNIATVDGLLTVASPEAGGLPNGILADVGPDWRRIGLQCGMVVHASDAHVWVPSADLEIRLGGAHAWSPRLRPEPEAARAASAVWRRRAAATRRIAQTRIRTSGLGAFLTYDVTRDDRLGTAARARPILAEMIVALDARDRGSAARLAVGLLGLGPGLTPSGDDALVGIEAGLHALDASTAGFLALALGDVEDRTTRLAATLLHHAARGEFAERLHDLLGALLGSDEEAIPMAIERAAAWGATSGADCLLGVLIGLDVASGVRGPLPS